MSVGINLVRRLLPLSAAALSLVALAGWIVVSAAPEAPVYGQAPTFALTAQDGTMFTADHLRGKAWLASILFTQCIEACPVLTPWLVKLQQRLAAEGLLGEKARMVTFSADPERDTPEELRTYGERYGADLATWTFLTGDAETVRSVIKGGFKLGVDRVGLELHRHDDGTEHQHYDVLHSTRLVLVDGDGRIRAYYPGLEVEPEVVARDVRRLVGGWWSLPLPRFG